MSRKEQYKDLIEEKCKEAKDRLYEILVKQQKELYEKAIKEDDFESMYKYMKNNFDFDLNNPKKWGK